MNHTMRDESGYDSGLSSTALTSEKIAVLAPTPIARVRMARRAKPGVRRNDRNAYRISWVAASTKENPRRLRPIVPEPTPRPGQSSKRVRPRHMGLAAMVVEGIREVRSCLVSSDLPSDAWQKSRLWRSL